MKKANVKPQVIWITRNKGRSAFYRLYSREPDKEPFDNNSYEDTYVIETLCPYEFHRLCDIRLRPGQKKRLYGYFTFVEVKE